MAQIDNWTTLFQAAFLNSQMGKKQEHFLYELISDVSQQKNASKGNNVDL